MCWKPWRTAGSTPAELNSSIEHRAPRYLAYYQRIDLGLDTFPYNGHTTTLDSMWSGVPVITMIGDALAGRAGWSQLNNLGLQRLAAASGPDFVGLAAEVCGNLGELSELRALLRERLMHSPLMDGAELRGM